MQNRIASIHDVFSVTFVAPHAVELIRLSLSAQRLPKPATIDLIEVRRLVYSSRNPKRADHLASALDQKDENVEGAAAEPQRPVALKQKPLLRKEQERAKRDCASVHRSRPWF